MGIIAEEWISDQGVHLSVHRTNGFARLRGLIARRPMPAASALLIPNCGSVHGVGMVRRIDLVFLDRCGRIVLVRRLNPFSFASCTEASHVLELAAGEATRLGLRRGGFLSPQTNQFNTEGGGDR